jgi:hypothetical protein
MSEQIKSVLKICRRCGDERLCKITARTCNSCFNKPNNERLKAMNYFNENSKKYYTPIPKDQQLKRGRPKKVII